MVKGIKTRYQRLKSAAALMLLSASVSVQAGLPTVAAPSSGSSGNFLQMLRDYGKDAVLIIGFLIGAGAFVMVARNGLGVNAEIGDGKKKWSDLAMHVIVGGALLLAVIYLLTESAKVIP